MQRKERGDNGEKACWAELMNEPVSSSTTHPGMTHWKKISQNSLVDGEKFAALADLDFRDPFTEAAELCPDRIRSTARRVRSREKRLAVVHVDSGRVRELFKQLRETASPDFALLSHNGDANFTTADSRDRPSCVVQWFGQNLNVSNGPSLFSLPIGLERRFWSRRRFGETGLKRKKLLRHRRTSYCTRNLLYVNFGVSTNEEKRAWIPPHFQTKDWAVVRREGLGGDLDRYYREAAESAFALSPIGHGLDCHRTWELLYLGVIPVVERTPLFEQLYDDLPVLIVDDIRDLTRSYLRSALTAMRSTSYDFSPLSFAYWRRAISRRLQVRE